MPPTKSAPVRMQERLDTAERKREYEQGRREAAPGLVDRTCRFCSRGFKGRPVAHYCRDCNTALHAI